MSEGNKNSEGTFVSPQLPVEGPLARRLRLGPQSGNSGSNTSASSGNPKLSEIKPEWRRRAEKGELPVRDTTVRSNQKNPKRGWGE